MLLYTKIVKRTLSVKQTGESSAVHDVTNSLLFSILVKTELSLKTEAKFSV